MVVPCLSTSSDHDHDIVTSVIVVGMACVASNDEYRHKDMFPTTLINGAGNLDRRVFSINIPSRTPSCYQCAWGPKPSSM